MAELQHGQYFSRLFGRTGAKHLRELRLRSRAWTAWNSKAAKCSSTKRQLLVIEELDGLLGALPHRRSPPPCVDAEEMVDWARCGSDLLPRPSTLDQGGATGFGKEAGPSVFSIALELS